MSVRAILPHKDDTMTTKFYTLCIQVAIGDDGWIGSTGLPALTLQAFSMREAELKAKAILAHLPTAISYCITEQ